METLLSKNEIEIIENFKLPKKIYIHSHMIGGIPYGSRDPKLSAVSKDFKVNGVNNLWVCSLGLFPRLGNINPFLSLSALSVKLINNIYDELYKKKMGKR